MSKPKIELYELPNGDVAAVNPDGTCLLMFLQTEPGWYTAGDPVNALMLCHRPDVTMSGKMVMAFEAEDSGFEPAHVQRNKLRAFAEDFATCARIPKP